MFINRNYKNRGYACPPLFVSAACLVVLVLCGCADPNQAPPTEIVCGTSLITDIVTDLSDHAADTHTLLPSAACPSQFDMKPRDIVRLQQADLVLLHPWQLNLANIRRTLEAAGVGEDTRRIIPVEGNWMLPDTQLEAVQAVAETLIAYDPGSEAAVREQAAARSNALQEILEHARLLLPETRTGGVPVVCHEMQRPFLAWAGFTIVRTFNRPEDWSVAETEALVQAGRKGQAVLVVDNLQSGGLAMSETLARDMGAHHVVLSNFPGGFPDTATWDSAFLANVKRIAESLNGSPLP